MSNQIFNSPKAKRTVVITNKNGTYKLPQQLPTSRGIFGNFRKIPKLSGIIAFNALTFSENKYFLNANTKLLKSRNWIFPTVRHFSWNLKFVSSIFADYCGVLNLKIYFLHDIAIRKNAVTVPKCDKEKTFENYIKIMQTYRNLLCVQPQNVISVS